VNVLLVPAHPGFPGQIPQSRKTVVCVYFYDTLVQELWEINDRILGLKSKDSILFCGNKR